MYILYIFLMPFLSFYEIQFDMFSVLINSSKNNGVVSTIARTVLLLGSSVCFLHTK